MKSHKTTAPTERATRPKNRRTASRPLDLPEVFQVVIECRDEADQRELYQRLVADGRKCRLLVM